MDQVILGSMFKRQFEAPDQTEFLKTVQGIAERLKSASAKADMTDFSFGSVRRRLMDFIQYSSMSELGIDDILNAVPGASEDDVLYLVGSGQVVKLPDGYYHWNWSKSIAPAALKYSGYQIEIMNLLQRNYPVPMSAQDISSVGGPRLIPSDFDMAVQQLVADGHIQSLGNGLYVGIRMDPSYRSVKDNVYGVVALLRDQDMPMTFDEIASQLQMGRILLKQQLDSLVEAGVVTVDQFDQYESAAPIAGLGRTEPYRSTTLPGKAASAFDPGVVSVFEALDKGNSLSNFLPGTLEDAQVVATRSNFDWASEWVREIDAELNSRGIVHSFTAMRSIKSVFWTPLMQSEWGVSQTMFAQIQQAMRNNVDAQVDPQTGEVNSTGLAEDAASELGHDEWLDDETHPVWDVAVDVANAYELSHKSIKVAHPYPARRVPVFSQVFAKACIAYTIAEIESNTKVSADVQRIIAKIAAVEQQLLDTESQSNSIDVVLLDQRNDPILQRAKMLLMQAGNQLEGAIKQLEMLPDLKAVSVKFDTNDILDEIAQYDQEGTSEADLISYYGSSVVSQLHELQSQGLIQNLPTGNWVITTRGSRTAHENANPFDSFPRGMDSEYPRFAGHSVSPLVLVTEAQSMLAKGESASLLLPGLRTALKALSIKMTPLESEIEDYANEGPVSLAEIISHMQIIGYSVYASEVMDTLSNMIDEGVINETPSGMYFTVKSVPTSLAESLADGSLVQKVQDALKDYMIGDLRAYLPDPLPSDWKPALGVAPSKGKVSKRYGYHTATIQPLGMRGGFQCWLDNQSIGIADSWNEADSLVDLEVNTNGFNE